MDSASALQASEERLQRALDATGLCLWDFDVPSGNIYLSESWSVRLGGAHVATRTTFSKLAELVPEAEQAGLVSALIASLKTPGLRHRVEHRVRRLDGEYIWNLSEGAVISWTVDGRALRMVGTNRDTTAERRAQETQRALEAQLREAQKMEAIGALAAGIAHDFNNILASILGNVALARDDIEPAHPATKNLQQIQRSATRAKALVRQILTFARRQPSELACRPLAPIFDEVRAMLQATLPASVQLGLELPGHSPHCQVDAGQIHQLLVNLATNAWHALRAGTGSITLGLDRALPRELAATIGGEHAHLWVRDDGSGMDADTQARLFEPFFTTKPAGVGTGLGLAVVHGIVEAHHGRIVVESAPGAGSTFHVYLPSVEAPADAPMSEWDVLPEPAVNAAARHILYVDDDDAIVTLVASLLARAGHRSTCVSSAQQALAALRERPDAFDLAISDFNMPNLSGLHFAREAAVIRPGLPVAISSGFLSEADRADLLGAGVKGFLQKENTVQELSSFIERLLHREPSET